MWSITGAFIPNGKKIYIFTIKHNTSFFLPHRGSNEAMIGDFGSDVFFL